MERSARAEKIILEAPQWSFEGDCSLLAWMQELSKNLEQRATNTSRALQQLSINVNRSAISLDNAANSLTALQYTQFVESRCHDDDETVPNIANMATETINLEEETKSPNEILQTFLRKNLEMLHNCHEKYALDIEDSDEEEAANNCIYQPKNPYNEALLPHIYGSKLWKEHWHIGLCDGDNEYSGDEISEAFSETSTSAEDNESYESNTANLSEWASSTSIPIESKHPAQIRVQNNTSLGVSPTDLAHDKHINSAVMGVHSAHTAGSDTSSTTSRSTTTHQPHIREHDLFADLKDTPTTSTSSISATQHLPANSSSGSNTTRYMTLPPLYDTTPPNDIFAEPTQPASATGQSAFPTSTNQIKRKPVNLFDDDDFNSFMTEIVDKAQAKVEPPVPAARNLSTNVEKSTTVEKAPKRVLDLFDETLQNHINEVVEPMQSKQTTQPSIQEKKVSTRKPAVDLFSSPEGSPTNKTLLFPTPKTATKEDNKSEMNEPIAKIRITAKSLFDDDDDDDFLNVFGAKRLGLPQTSGKTILFDDDEDKAAASHITTVANESKKSVVFPQRNFFDNNEPSLATETVTNNKTATENKNNQTILNNSQQKQMEETHEKEAELTVDYSIEVKSNDEQIIKPFNKLQNNLFGTNFFDDNDDDVDDLFSKKKFMSDKEEKPREQSKLNLPRKPIFENNFDKDLFGESSKEDVTEKVIEKTFDIIADVTEIVAQTHNNSTLDKLYEITSEPPPLEESHTKSKYKPLFSDDFDDEGDDDLFRKMKTKKTINAKNEQDPSVAVNMYSVPVEQNTSNASMNVLIDNNEQSNLVTTATPVLNEVKTALIASPEKLPHFEDIPEDESYVSENNDEKEKQETANVTNKLNIFEPPVKNTPTAITQINFQEAEVVNVNANVCLVTEKPQENVDVNMPSENPTTTVLVGRESEEVPDTSANPISISVTSIAEQSSIEKPSLQQQAAVPHNFTGIFLDEPPDDDDFIQTFSSSRKLSASKITLDLESDFYEPALPATPSAQKESHKAEMPSSEYGGLRLFSEIPPDDDDDSSDDFNSQRTNANLAQSTNRLHSIFYDDFTETLEAVQQINESKKIPTHSLFDDEPPPDDDDFDVIGKFTKVNVERTTDVAQSFEENQSTAKPDAVLKRGASKITEDETLKTATSHKISVDVPDRKVVIESATEVEKSRNSTGKLQMPKININVQALLPGTGARTNFKKPSEEQPKIIEAAVSANKQINATSQEQSIPDHAPISKPASTSAAGTVSENVLSNMCKNRVRAPAKRRPSTRKARQENYQQSLRAEQKEFSDDGSLTASMTSIHINQKEQIIPRNLKGVEVPKERNEVPEVSEQERAKQGALDDVNVAHTAIQNIPHMRVDKAKGTPTLPVHRHNISNAEIVTAPTTQSNGPILSTKASTTLFDDLTADNDDLFRDINVLQQVKTDAPKATTRQIDRSTVPKREVGSKSLFSDEPSDESDDNLFKTSTANKTKSAAPKTVATQVKPIFNTSKKVNTLFGSDDDNDDDADFLTQLKNKTKPTIADGGVVKASGGAGNLFSDAESDEGDLFASKTQITKTATKQNNGNIKSVEKTALPKTPATTKNSAKANTLADNPLADLFDS